MIETKSPTGAKSQPRRKRRAAAAAALANMEIEPWEKDGLPDGPSHETWYKWNNQHGAMLRLACGVMTKNKSGLADFALFLEREGLFENLRGDLERSAEFFRDMAQIIESANFRLLVSAAVCYGRQPKTEGNSVRPGEDPLDGKPS